MTPRRQRPRFDATPWAELVEEALEAFLVDERYAAKIARRAHQIMRRRERCRIQHMA